jgi:phosphotransferase system  glucose/maltose/N-acetylglucosamine-specific IIC component
MNWWILTIIIVFAIIFFMALYFLVRSVGKKGEDLDEQDKENEKKDVPKIK